MAVTQEKHFYTISEVSELCNVKPHVLRYWEKEFESLQPSTRRGRRRYYQPHDIEHIQTIRRLLYDEGFTINGARAKLGEQAVGRKKRSLAKSRDLPVDGSRQAVIAALDDVLALL